MAILRCPHCSLPLTEEETRNGKCPVCTMSLVPGSAAAPVTAQPTPLATTPAAQSRSPILLWSGVSLAVLLLLCVGMYIGAQMAAPAGTNETRVEPVQPAPQQQVAARQEKPQPSPETTANPREEPRQPATTELKPKTLTPEQPPTPEPKTKPEPAKPQPAPPAAKEEPKQDDPPAEPMKKEVAKPKAAPKPEPIPDEPPQPPPPLGNIPRQGGLKLQGMQLRGGLMMPLPGLGGLGGLGGGAMGGLGNLQKQIDMIRRLQQQQLDQMQQGFPQNPNFPNPLPGGDGGRADKPRVLDGVTETRELNEPNGEFEVPALRGGAVLRLKGKIGKLKVGPIDGSSALDASKLDADEIFFNDRIDSQSRVKVHAPEGTVIFRARIDDHATVSVQAPGGRVLFVEPPGPRGPGSKIDGNAIVTITAKQVDFRANIQGDTTKVTVTLTEGGKLRFRELDGTAKLHYRKANETDAAPVIEEGAVRGKAEFMQMK